MGTSGRGDFPRSDDQREMLMGTGGVQGFGELEKPSLIQPFLFVQTGPH